MLKIFVHIDEQKNTLCECDSQFGANIAVVAPSNYTKVFHIVNKNCATCTFVKLHNKKAVENCCAKCTNGILHKK